MNTFTASNGVVVKSYSDDRIEIECSGNRDSTHNLSVSEAEAMHEFFRAVEDERLGRFRTSEAPDYVAYDRGDGYCRVVREVDGTSEVFLRQDVGTTGGFIPATVARAFFDAHPEPEPKPWHKAEPGQVWLVNGKVRAVVERAREPHTFADPFYREMGIPVTDPSIVDARRITWEPNS